MAIGEVNISAGHNNFSFSEIAVDCVVFGYVRGSLEILLIHYNNKTGGGNWGLPTGFLQTGENPDAAAQRVINEINSNKIFFIKQLKTYCSEYSLPLNRRIIISYYALINLEKYRIDYSQSKGALRWFKINDIPKLIHNHNSIVDMSLMQINVLIRESPIALHLLPEKFTLTELMNFYQEILDVKTDKSDFRKKVLNKKLLVPLDEMTYDHSCRPVRLYKINSAICENITDIGVVYDF